MGPWISALIGGAQPFHGWRTYPDSSAARYHRRRVGCLLPSCGKELRRPLVGARGEAEPRSPPCAQARPRAPSQDRSTAARSPTGERALRQGDPRRRWRDLGFRATPPQRVWGAKSTIAVPLDGGARGSSRTRAPAKGATAAPPRFSPAIGFGVRVEERAGAAEKREKTK